MIQQRLPITVYRVDENPRYHAMLEWVQGLLGRVAVLEGAKMPPAPLPTDASNRRFYRLVVTSGSLILVDALPATEAGEDYLMLSKWYSAQGFHVPQIYAHDLEAGYFVVSDLGEHTYLDVLESEPERADALYVTAMSVLQRLVRIEPDILPIYTKERFDAELELFATWFVRAWLRLPMPSGWVQLKEALLEAVTSQPKVCTHRDFHSRNLLHTQVAKTSAGAQETLKLGIVDYQDSLQGPLCYDIASLLWDCYIDWPEAVSLSRLNVYYEGLPDSLKAKLSSADFERQTLLTASQRHLKALGIFARLHVQEGRSQYLASIPRVLDYLALHLQELSPDFSDWIATGIKRRN